MVFKMRKRITDLEKKVAVLHQQYLNLLKYQASIHDTEIVPLKLELDHIKHNLKKAGES